ncbi:Orotidine 5'-phosphate decarboxylase [hydrothermal vent metagenome]|uniref:Orotidine 5'-phosphate decarboxylase n=1 Tax=hydrothermal vent metagenome TaxID=652676 RepID=A0A3B0VDF8_9ZZZZ
MQKIDALKLDLATWLTQIVDAVAANICAFKPQIAHFSAIAAENELRKIINYIHAQYPHIPVILDAKRGDIGSTASNYAIEAFEKYQADAVTVNPYLGQDSLQPFLDYADKGVIVLCKTSNAGSVELQDLQLHNGKKLFQQVAYNAANNWNKNNNVLLVVGATYPQELAKIRTIVGEMPLLIPGIGTQGGDIKATLQAGLNKNLQQSGLIISSSRSIIYAGNTQDNFANKAKNACINLNKQINDFWSI